MRERASYLGQQRSESTEEEEKEKFDTSNLNDVLTFNPGIDILLQVRLCNCECSRVLYFPNAMFTIYYFSQDKCLLMSFLNILPNSFDWKSSISILVIGDSSEKL